MGYTSTVYPYMPLTVVAHVPSLAVFGDYRVGMAICLLASVALLRATAKRLAVDDVVVDVLTLALVFYPRAAYVIGSGYNEPLLVFHGRALRVSCRTFALRIASGGGLHAVAGAQAILLRAANRVHHRPLAATCLQAVTYRGCCRARNRGAVSLSNPQATVAGILFQASPAVAFRPDSVSLTALVAALTGIEPFHWLPEVVQLTVTAAMFWWLRNCGLGGVLLASGVALTASFLVGTQAFANNYEFASALLLFAALVLAGRDAPA